MKKLLSTVLAATMMLSLVACGGSKSSAPADTSTSTAPSTSAATSTATPAPSTEAPATTEGKFKVAIVTNTVSQNEEEYRSAQALVTKYGPEKIVHVTWPDNFMAEQEQMVSIVAKLASDPDLTGLVINQAVPGTNAAVDKLKETRDDIFIVYCTPQENPPDVSSRANLIIQPDEYGMGYAMPTQAKKLGAKTFVHYSFPRHMSQVLLAGRREIMIAECKKLGLEFVDATAPDPTSDVGTSGAQQFILEDVPKMIAKYGKDTAFFSTNCAMQIPLIKAVADGGGIYPQPCCPSPFHGYPAALGIEQGDLSSDSIKYVVDETTRILKEKGVLGRFSTWPVPFAMMGSDAGTEYAIKWAKGEVSKDKLDIPALEACMATYAGLPVKTTAYTEKTADGKEVTYENYRLGMMDYLTYGE